MVRLPLGVLVCSWRSSYQAWPILPATLILSVMLSPIVEALVVNVLDNWVKALVPDSLEVEFVARVENELLYSLISTQQALVGTPAVLHQPVKLYEVEA